MNNNFSGKLKTMVFTLLLVAFSGLTPTVVYAADGYVCDAKQNSRDELAVLAESCPVGQGLWGRKPKQDSGFFWIQCGVFPQPLTLAQVKPIYEKISADVWMKPEENHFRCLIGPYNSFKLAEKESRQIRTLSAYKESFVRQVAENGHAEKLSAGNKQATVVEAKQKQQAQPTVKARPEVGAKSSAEKAKPLAKETQSAAMLPKASTVVKSAVSAAGITMRRSIGMQGYQFVIPFLDEGNEQFYMEYGIAWNRLDYDKAEQVCTSLGMYLVSEPQWKLLLSSGVMSREEWPLHLPYWGQGKLGLFTSGKVTHLTGTSLLNVVCMK